MRIKDKENLIKYLSFEFALKIIELYKHLTTEKKEYVLIKTTSPFRDFNWC